VPLAKTLTASVNGQLINVVYTLKIFIRHDSMQQFGEGECVTFPIKIMERPFKIGAQGAEQNFSLQNEVD